MSKHPKMTKAHFTYLAGLMAEIQPPRGEDREYNQWVYTVRSLGVALTWTNDSFDVNKFVEACGL